MKNNTTSNGHYLRNDHPIQFPRGPPKVGLFLVKAYVFTFFSFICNLFGCFSLCYIKLSAIIHRIVFIRFY